MNVLPLVQRELRVALRSPFAYRLRMAVGGGAMGLTVWVILVWSGWSAGASFGRMLLMGLTGLGFAGAALAGMLLCADCVSRERREGTLGLLFLTDLQSADVVFGKLAAKALLPLYALMAAFPAVAVCILFGGVTAGEFWRLVLVLGNTLFLSLSLCLMTSTLCEQHRFAHGGAFLSTLTIFAAPPAIGLGLSFWLAKPVWRALGCLFSPTGSYLLAFDSTYQLGPAWFWGSLLLAHLTAWICLSFACFILPSTWRGRESKPVRSSSTRRRPLPGAQRTSQERWRAELLARLPISWLAERYRPHPILLWLVPILALLLCNFHPDPLGKGAGQISFGLLVIVHLFFNTWLAAHTSYVFAKDRQNGTLELLLGTPLQISEIGKGMLSGLRRHFGPPLLALVGLDLALAVYLAFTKSPAAVWPLAGALTTVINCYCICWIAMWRGLASRSPALAIISTVATILLMPWGWFAVGAVLFARSSFLEFTGLWLVLAAVNNVIFLIKAKEGFARYFRTMALRPVGTKGPPIQSNWSPIVWEEEDVGSDEPLLN
jgi:hypothetical protein